MSRYAIGAASLLVGLGGVVMFAAGSGCIQPPPPPECTANADCDDGLFCNGDETCVTGACQEGADPCEAESECDEEANECVPPAAGCEVDDDCDEGEFCDIETGECVDNVNLFAVTKVDADYAERVHLQPSGHATCTVCHHAADAGAGLPDAAGMSCRTCHPDEPNEVNSFKDVAHDENESNDGCRACHAAEFEDNCAFCHPDAVQ